MARGKIYYKNAEELELMRRSGEISALALKETIAAAKPGVSLLDLEKIAIKEINRHGATAAFQSVQNYRFATCLTINDELVHGIPRDIKLKKGDLLSIDLGAKFKGWCTDCAWSLVVGEEDNFFLKIGEKGMWAGIDKAVVGNHIGDISQAIQEVVEGAGFSVSRSLIGHGVGKELHEAPEVPGYGQAGEGVIIKEGMVLAIEVIYAGGRSDVVLADDGWTLRTEDHSLGGLFEMSVIVGKNPEVITDWRNV